MTLLVSPAVWPFQCSSQGAALAGVGLAVCQCASSPAAAAETKGNGVPGSRGCCQVQVAKQDSMRHWQLYLVDWGYNTPAERQKAAQHDRLQVVNIDEFKRLAH